VRILVTSNGFEDDPETWYSLDELAAELEVSATEEYAEQVLSQLRAGAKKVTVANGPQATDTYTVED
jgi:hypothetical protein